MYFVRRCARFLVVAVALVPLFSIAGCNFLRWNSGGSQGDKPTGSDTVGSSGCEGREFCDDTTGDTEAQAACKAYRTCLAVTAVDDPMGLGVTKSPGISEPAGTAAGANCNAVKECPKSPTGNHVFRPDDPPEFTYEVDDDGSCTRTKMFHCIYCGTTYSHAAPPEQVTLSDMLRDHEAALRQQSPAAGHIASVMQTAEMVARRLKLPGVCSPSR